MRWHQMTAWLHAVRCPLRLCDLWRMLADMQSGSLRAWLSDLKPGHLYGPRR